MRRTDPTMPAPRGGLPAPVRRPWRRALTALLGSRGLLLAALAGAVTAGVAFAGGGSSGTAVAYFTDAAGLVPGEEVLIAGVHAGSVSSVEVTTDPATQRPAALTRLSIEGSHWPLHQGTRLAVRPVSVLGNVYVDLVPGSAQAPALGGTPAFHTDVTQSPVNIDEINNTFSPDVRTALRTQLQEGVVAFGGGGAQDLNQLIERSNPLTADLDPLTATLAARTPELDRLNGEFSTVTAELGGEDANLRGLIASADATLGALASRERQLQGTLEHAAGTLTSLDSGLRGEEGNLRAIFEKGPKALADTRRGADLTRQLVSGVNPAIPDLQTLLNEFLTATGFQNLTPNNRIVDTLRIDVQITNPSGRVAVPCGGEPTEQPGCPYHPNTGSSGAAAGSTTGGSGGGSGAAAIPDNGQGDLAAALGGLFQ